MRAPILLSLLSMGIVSSAQVGGVRINEVMPACQRSFTDERGGHPDWIELVATGREAIDLQGHMLSTGLHHHRLAGPLVLSPRGRLLLRCDGRTELGPEHIDLRLPRAGGTLLLIAPDGSTVVDLFSWPALPADVSIGRCPDGTAAWSLFANATPGAPNPSTTEARRVLSPPLLERRGDRLVAKGDPNATVRFTLDASPVSAASPVLDSLRLPAGPVVVRARAYAPGALPSGETAYTPELIDAATTVALTVAPSDLFDPVLGIIGDSTHANYARSQAPRRVPCLVELPFDTMPGARQLGLGVAGSGTRGSPKRSYKLFARDRYGDDGPIPVTGLGEWDELMLRADGTPNAFLHNLFVEAVVRQAGLRVDMPSSVACDLLLNGEDQGLYRLLPPKNGDWLCGLHGVEAIELADGPGGTMLRGERTHLDRTLEALRNGAPVASLDSLLDIGSLIDLACLDLYTGRADHDLNVRCWRPRTADGRWRWIVFDMDLWAPSTENSVARMCGASALEAPYLPQLLREDCAQRMLMARLEALLLTTLGPESAEAVIDSLDQRYRALLDRDDARWGGQLDRPSRSACVNELRTHARTRPGALLGHLASYTGRRSRPFEVSVPPVEQGTVEVEGLTLAPGTTTLALLAGVPLRFHAKAAPGWHFTGWAGQADAGTPELVVDPARTGKVRAVFRRGGSGDDGLQQ